MSHHDHGHDPVKELMNQRQNFYLTPSAVSRGAIAFCVLMGVVALALAFSNGEAHRAWGALLFNTFFFFALALGGSAFSAMQDIVGAKWGRAVMRIHESFSSFLPVAAFIFLSILVSIKMKFLEAHSIYKWIDDPSMLRHYWGKRVWLKENFMLIRDVFALLLILSLAFWQIGIKTTRDRAAVEGNHAEATRLGKIAKEKLRYWSAPLLITYALAFSLLGFDLLMSLAPTWLSTLFGGWLFAIMMQTLMASLLVTMWILKSSPIGSVIQRNHFHDVGKLMHGFTIFFAYLTYAHVLTYWYGNVPEETQYFIKRLESPWIYIVLLAPVVSFVIPLYGMIPKASKWTKMIGGSIAIGILVAQWFTYLLVVMPEVVGKGQMNLPWVELGTFLGVFGLFLWSVFNFGRRNPMVSIGDPLLHEAMAEAGH